MEHRLAEIMDWPQRAHAANYCVRTLAKNCGVSLRNLERFFHEQRRQTPHDWMHEERMGGAVELLRKGSSVKVTAAELGYQHAHHFSRDFKTHFGCCPANIALTLPVPVLKAALNAKWRVSV